MIFAILRLNISLINLNFSELFYELVYYLFVDGVGGFGFLIVGNFLLWDCQFVFGFYFS